MAPKVTAEDWDLDSTYAVRGIDYHQMNAGRSTPLAPPQSKIRMMRRRSYSSNTYGTSRHPDLPEPSRQQTRDGFAQPILELQSREYNRHSDRSMNEQLRVPSSTYARQMDRDVHSNSPAQDAQLESDYLFAKQLEQSLNDLHFHHQSESRLSDRQLNDLSRNHVRHSENHLDPYQNPVRRSEDPTNQSETYYQSRNQIRHLEESMSQIEFNAMYSDRSMNRNAPSRNHPVGASHDRMSQSETWYRSRDYPIRLNNDPNRLSEFHATQTDRYMNDHSRNHTRHSEEASSRRENNHFDRSKSPMLRTDRSRENSVRLTPRSKAQSLRTGPRLLSRQSSVTEPAQISRPEPAQVTRPGPRPQSPPPRLRLLHESTPVLVPRPPTTAAAAATIEIEPGVTAPLRSTEETLQAIARDEFVAATCLGCEADVFCISNAKFMICPHCRVVNPLLVESTHLGSEEKVYGVGLGFTHKTLLEHKKEQQRTGPY